MPLDNRLELYPDVVVDDNIEKDYLSTTFTSYDFENYSLYKVPQALVGRLDMISYIHYQTVEFWWLIAQANDIMNIHDEMYSGQNLKIPNIYDFYNYKNQNVRV